MSSCGVDGVILTVGYDSFGGDTLEFGAQRGQVHVAVDAAELLAPLRC